MLDESALRHLRWLAQQGQPMWGGHLERGEPLKDADVKSWLDAGLIKLVGNKGYMITDKGRTVLEK